jgi:DNA polymerase-3 subunit beta
MGALKMKLSLRKSDLKAALICSAVKDIRYYLQGVYFEFSPSASGVLTDGILTFAATDGHILFAGTAPAIFESDPQSAPFWMIIPSHAVKAAIKTKNDVVILRSLPDGSYSIGDIIFAPIDAKFPDFRRVIPASVSGETGHYDPELLVRGNDALREYFGDKSAFYMLNNNGKDAGVICGNCQDALVVVMPIRIEGMEYTGHAIPAMPAVVADIQKAA